MKNKEKKGGGDAGSRSSQLVFNFNWKKWLFMSALALAYLASLLILGPPIDERFRLDTCSVLASNYVVRNLCDDSLTWKALPKHEVKWLLNRVNGGVEGGLEAVGGGGRGDPKKPRKRDLSHRNENGTAKKPDATRRCKSVYAWRNACYLLPKRYDPLAFSPYYMENDCSASSLDLISSERLDEILEAYSPGYVESFPLSSEPKDECEESASGGGSSEVEQALRRRSFSKRLKKKVFERVSVGSKCAKGAVLEQRESRYSDVFSVYSFLSSSLCALRCKKALDTSTTAMASNSTAERNSNKGAPSMGGGGIDPWFTIDWANDNTTTEELSSSMLSTLSPSYGFSSSSSSVVPSVAIETGRKYSWMYSCDLKKRILEGGSVLVAFDTSWEFLVNYKSGVYTLENVPNNKFERRRVFVTLVGWGYEGEEEGYNYFLGTLPYGAHWGSEGFIKINENELYVRNERFKDEARNVYTMTLCEEEVVR